VLPVIGQVVNGGETNDSTPTLKGTLTDLLGAGQSLHLYRDGMDLGQMDVNGLNWSYDEAGLVAYTHYTYVAKVVDQMGGVVDQSAEISFTYNPVPITGVIITGVLDDQGPVTGLIPSNGWTDDTTPQLSGTLAAPLDPAQKLEIWRSNNGVDAKVGDASVSGTNWNYQDSGLADNQTYSYTARIVDGAGGPVLTSEPWVIKVWTTPPGAVTIDSYDDDVAPFTGNFPGDTTTDDTTPLLHGTVTGAAAGDVLTLYDGTTVLGTVPVTPGAGSQNWTFQITTPLLDGPHNFVAKLVNVTGAETDSGPFLITVDTSVPPTVTIDAIMDDVGPGIGLINSRDITNDSTPELRGTVSQPLLPGQDVLIFRNDDYIGNAGPFTGTQWSFTDTSGGMLDDREYTYTAQVKTAAGNLSPVTLDSTFVMTLDLGGQVSISPITGDNVIDATEAHSTLTISGTLTDLPDGATGVQVVVHAGGADHTAVVTGTTWSITVAGSDLVNSAPGGHGTVNVTLNFNDSTGVVSNPVTKDQTYQISIEPPVSHTYTVNTPYAGLGYAMTAVSDFNGDGYADYLVSAPGTHYGNLLAAGKSVMYLLYGSASGLPNVTDLDTITASQGIRITSSSKCGVGLQGMTVTDIGDFNGDGLSDVAISSSANNMTYVLFGQQGSSTQTVDLNKLTAQQGFSVAAACWAPASAAGADVNGDGYSDLIISNLDGGTSCSGAAYVIYGHAGTQGNITYTGSTVKGAVAGYTTESGNNGLGTVLSAVGDVNGDGYTDFVATMPGNANSSCPGNLAGSAYLVFGGPNGVSQPGTTSVNLAKANSSQVITITASNYYEHLGGQAGYGGNTLNADAYKAEFHSVTSLGNIDGSGKSAFAIGSPGASPGTSKSTTAYTCGTVSEGAGAVYVLYGQTSWSNITLPSWSSVTKTWSGGSLNGTNGYVLYSSSFANQANGKVAGASDLGSAVSSAGDVNGDGIDDMLIGAPGAYGGKGAVYLVFGKAGGLNNGAAAVDLDTLVAAGKAGAYGTPGTAIEYVGTTTIAQQSKGGSNMGTDVAGGDFSGTGLHGYTFSAWGESNGTKIQTGEAYVYDGITTFLTQQISNANGAVYYGGNGVDRIATGSGTNVWVHGVGVDDITGPFTTTVGHDAVSGGAGSDFIGIVSTQFTSVNGGSGTDTLVFEASNITLNLGEMGLRVQGFEQFDLNNSAHTAAGDPSGLFAGETHNNTLALRLSDVLSQMSSAPNSQRMTITGGADSTVDLIDTGWTKGASQTIGTTTFDVWHNSAQGSNTVADLLIQQGVHVI
jgi:hypothetical protein